MKAHEGLANRLALWTITALGLAIVEAPPL